ncbi:MAG: hypothetical protein KC609_20285, partial [Myxococcales bacterium]|nr:hypothetical protein [Myxococcales bacterium]
PQTIRIDGSIAYVVNSGSNNIQRLDLETGTNTKAFVRFVTADGERPTNPWGLALFRRQNRLFGLVSGNLDDSLLIVDLEGGVVEARLRDGFDAPQAVVVEGDLGFVANTAYRYPSWGEGSVSVVDLASRTVVHRLPTCARNPQNLVVTPDWLFVVSTGALRDEGGRFLPAESGCVDVYERAGIEHAVGPLYSVTVAPNLERPSIGAPIGAALTLDGHWLYLSSATSAALFVIDLDQRTLRRGSDDPILLADSDDNELLSLRRHSTGELLVLRYNRDQLLVLEPDPTLEAPVRRTIELGEHPTELEGPVDLAVSGERVFVVMGISNRIVSVDLSGGATSL